MSIARFAGFFMFFVLMANTATSQVVYYDKANKKLQNLMSEAQGHFNQRNYHQAAEILEKATEQEPKFVDAWFMLGVVHRERTGDLETATEAFEKTVKLDAEYQPKAGIYLAYSYFDMGEFDKAKKAAKSYSEIPSLKSEDKFMAENLMKSCDFAPTAIENPVPFSPKPLVKANTMYPEYFPALTADESKLFFTRQGAEGRKDENIWFVERKNDEWSSPKPVNEEVNTYNNEGAHTVAQTGNYLIFTRCIRNDCEIYLSKKKGYKWGEPLKFPSVNSKSWDSQPSLAADSRTIYFVSARSGGYGGKDIYKSVLQSDGTFSKPTNLGPTINTPGDEDRPFIHADGKTLYFTSDGHPGVGGLDIFYTTIKAEGGYETPINIGYPINTNNDDWGIYVSADGRTAYFSSDREGGAGAQDIYYFTLYEDARPEVVTYVKGYTFDKRNDKKISAALQLIDLETETVISTFSSDEITGEYLVTIPVGKEYAFNVTKDGYLFHSENFSLVDHDPDKNFELNIGLDKIEVGNKVILNNIFFDSGKFDLKEASNYELGKLTDMLTKNPTLKVEISGHTDNIGKPEDNRTLSENRAKAVFDYLIKNGIVEDRLTFKGYGETDPIASNDTEEGRAQNRRTEMKIVEK